MCGIYPEPELMPELKPELEQSSDLNLRL